MPGRGKFRREGISPLVGDWVQVRDLGGEEGFVEAIEPRQNRFAAPPPANIDQLVIIGSPGHPHHGSLPHRSHCLHRRPEGLPGAAVPE